MYGVLILSCVVLFGYFITTNGNSLPEGIDVDALKKKLQTEKITDAIGNELVVFLPPELEDDAIEPTQQELENISKANEIAKANAICTNSGNFFYNQTSEKCQEIPEGETVESMAELVPEEAQIDPITGDVMDISFSKNFTKIISSSYKDGVWYVKRSNILSIPFQIKIIDNKTSTADEIKFVPGPFYWAGKILGSNGAQVYGTPPTLSTDNDGYDEFKWTTDLHDFLGRYTATIDVKEKTLTKLSKTYQIELIP